MRKQNLLSKKIRKQILSINNLLESYFNSLRRFILDAKKLRFDIVAYVIKKKVLFKCDFVKNRHFAKILKIDSWPSVAVKI